MKAALVLVELGKRLLLVLGEQVADALQLCTAAALLN